MILFHTSVSLCREIYEVAKERVKCEKTALDVVVKLVESERIGPEELKSAVSWRQIIEYRQ